MELHPTAFVLYGDIEFPLNQDKLNLLKAGYIHKYMDAAEHGYADDEIALVEYELFHKGIGDAYAMEEKRAHHPIMIRKDGTVISVETGEEVGKLLIT